jgi:phospholipase/lecithinase/hemolysin
MATAAVMLCRAVAAGPADAGPVRAASAPFSGLVVFGDSLSDSGNAGRFSDGPVWVEVIASRIGMALAPSRTGGTNYAVGGALTHGGARDVRAQSATFLAAQRGAVDPDALYVVSGGANDLLARGCGGGNREAAGRTAAAALRATIDDLAAAGARHFLVPNLPDIGLAPMVRAMGAACAAEARRLALAFNGALERELRRVEQKHGITVQRLDVFALAEQVMADPQAAGFTDVSTPCGRGPCEGALFWDYLHPTANAHARLAEAALAAVGAAPPWSPADGR